MPGTVTLTPTSVGTVNLTPNFGNPESFLLQESGFKLVLEDASGFLILDQGGNFPSLSLVPVVVGTVTATPTTAGSLTLTPKTVGSLTLGSP